MQRAKRNLNRDECVANVALSNEGLTNRELGRRFGVSYITVCRVLQRFVETKDHTRRLGQGKQRATNSVEDRFLKLGTLRERFTTALSLQIKLTKVHGTAVSHKTIRRRLRASNLRPQVAATCPRLSVDH